MYTHKSNSLITFLLVLGFSFTTFADWKDEAKSIKISGGEDYTLILTQNNWLWACGDNEFYQLGIGNTQTDQFIPVRVHGTGDIGFLEDITDFDAGWKHSLALDDNTKVWAWGNNQWGQLGDGTNDDEFTPVHVLGGSMGTTYLQNIITVACGRSGAHSLAVDANHYVWSWGNNNNGELGNGDKGTDQYTPVAVICVECRLVIT